MATRRLLEMDWLGEAGIVEAVPGVRQDLNLERERAVLDLLHGALDPRCRSAIILAASSISSGAAGSPMEKWIG